MLESGSKEWHAQRMLGIGGSDAAAALGMSKWKTPYQLYKEKIGESEPEPETWEMARGKAMEPLLRQHYADTTGREVIVLRTALVHPKYAFMRYNADGLIPDRLQEFKSAAYGHEWGEAGTDEIPQEYVLQVQHGMIVCQRDVADVTVSIAGNKPKYFVVEADHELQEMLIDQEADFWDKVTRRVAPEPSSNDDVAKMYSKVNGRSIVITPEIAHALTVLRILRQTMKDNEVDKERLEVTIKSFMGEAETLFDTDNFTTLATWKQQKGSKRIDGDLLRTMYPDAAADCTKQGESTRRFLLK